MRKYLCFISILLGISCANEKKEASLEYDPVLKNAELYEDEFQRREITLEQLTSQKLQDYFELLQLQKKHPQFKEEIEEQLRNFTKAGIIIRDTFEGVDVSNIKQVGKVIKVSDSVVKLKLVYDKYSKNSTNTDSVYAFITTKNIHLDDRQTVSNVIVFERIDCD